MMFSYIMLKEKAERELTRLQKAEDEYDEESAIDHALNAAFTIYHLIEWRSEESTPGNKIKVHNFVHGDKDKKIPPTQNEGIKVLHDVVTRNKHVIVSKKSYPDQQLDPALYTANKQVVTAQGDSVVTASGEEVVVDDKYIEVRFGENRALETLNTALNEFR